MSYFNWHKEKVDQYQPKNKPINRTLYERKYRRKIELIQATDITYTRCFLVNSEVGNTVKRTFELLLIVTCL